MPVSSLDNPYQELVSTQMSSTIQLSDSIVYMYSVILPSICVLDRRKFQVFFFIFIFKIEERSKQLLTECLSL